MEIWRIIRVHIIYNRVCMEFKVVRVPKRRSQIYDFNFWIGVINISSSDNGNMCCLHLLAHQRGPFFPPYILILCRIKSVCVQCALLHALNPTN